MTGEDVIEASTLAVVVVVVPVLSAVAPLLVAVTPEVNAVPAEFAVRMMSPDPAPAVGVATVPTPEAFWMATIRLSRTTEMSASVPVTV